MESSSQRFASYLEMRSSVPSLVWRLGRIASLLVTIILIVYMLVDGPRGLRLFWQVVLPTLPLLFTAAPGIWRQICPMAALNQWPVETGRSRGWALPAVLADYAYLIALSAFVLFVFARRPLLQESSILTATVLALGLFLALVGGVFFKGRSGWCGTFCPLGPIQKLYGHAPPVLVRNGYCRTCVGCQQNCYDFNPTAAIFADLDDLDEQFSGHRLMLPAILPGLILGFWLADPFGELGVAAYVQTYGVFILVSVGSFFVLKNILPISRYQLASLFGMSALILYYWFEALPLLGAVSSVLGFVAPPAWTSYLIIAAAVAVALRTLAAGFSNEIAYLRERHRQWEPSVNVDATAMKQGRLAAISQSIKEVSTGRSFGIDSNRTLLETFESAGIGIAYGCRMGVCGADPVHVISGHKYLSTPSDEELETLDRLGLVGVARMACVCRARGPVEINLAPDLRASTRVAAPRNEPNADPLLSAGVARVVIIGNGVAGVTFADMLRRASAECEIHIVCRESHHFYNRMALGRAIHGRGGMDELVLLPPEWFKQRNIHVWLNTIVSEINPAAHCLRLGLSDVLTYDRLVLATGASSRLPDIPGRGLHGVFALRTADDALHLRAWTQKSGARQALVVGGGPLGVEIAAALHQHGLRVTILHAKNRLLDAFLDDAASGILNRFLRGLGIEVVLGQTLNRLEGNERVSTATSCSGAVFDADLCVFCIGVEPNIELAKSAQLHCKEGIVVDGLMRTSDHDIFAVGDVIQRCEGQPRLWIHAQNDARRAVAGLLGSPTAVQESHSVVKLKVPGIDVICIGSTPTNREGLQKIEHHDEDGQEYRRVVVKGNAVVSATFIGAPGVGSMAASLVGLTHLPPSVLERLVQNDWGALDEAQEERDSVEDTSLMTSV